MPKPPKPSASYTGTIALELVTDNNGSGSPNWGDIVRAKVTTNAPQPWVCLTAKQGGNIVAIGWAGYFQGALGDGNFGLYSPQWTSGPADCTLELFQAVGTGRIASVAFHVDG